jgi:hypothetical protein
MKLCKDCKYLKDGLCMHLSAARIDYVDGEPLPNYMASSHRSWVDSNSCSPEARFFEPKSEVKNG